MKQLKYDIYLSYMVSSQCNMIFEWYDICMSWHYYDMIFYKYGISKSFVNWNGRYEQMRYWEIWFCGEFMDFHYKDKTVRRSYFCNGNRALEQSPVVNKHRVLRRGRRAVRHQRGLRVFRRIIHIDDRVNTQSPAWKWSQFCYVCDASFQTAWRQYNN